MERSLHPWFCYLSDADSESNILTYPMINEPIKICKTQDLI